MVHSHHIYHEYPLDAAECPVCAESADAIGEEEAVAQAERTQWFDIAEEYAREYGGMFAAEEKRDEEDRASGQVINRFHVAYRCRVPFRALYQALREAGASDPAQTARRMADEEARKAVDA